MKHKLNQAKRGKKPFSKSPSKTNPRHKTGPQATSKKFTLTIDTIEIKSPTIKIDPHKIRQTTREMIIKANAVLDKIDNKIAIIQAPTGSGKTHSIIEEVKSRYGNQILSKKVAIALPTRANVFNLGGLTENLKVDFGKHIGGETGDMTDIKDIGTIYTYGKLFEMLKIDPLLSNYEELILDEADVISAGQEVRWIPVLKWLHKVRPELKIILMSATLDIDGFRQLFDVNKEAIFTDLSHSRPRPIQQLYVTDLEAKSRDVVHPKSAIDYINFAIDAVTLMITGKNALIPNEAVLVFLPTISSVERMGTILQNKFQEQLEVRTLHSKKDMEELKKDISNPIAKSKIGVLIATDIIGRGINFSEELRINRVIHSGLSNRRNYNTITRRDILGVGVATSFDVTQAFGRAGRAINDTRPVVGMCLQPISKLKKGLDNSLNNNDPTYMILQCSRVLKRIQKLRNFPHIPKTLLEFITPVVIDLDRIKQSIEKLQILEALDENENITDFGTFLIDIGLDLDFGLMLYNSLNTSYWARLCDVFCLASRGSSLVDMELKEIYNAFVYRLAKSNGVKSDLEVFEFLTQNIENFEDAVNCGVNYNTYLEAMVSSKALKRKINEYISGSTLDTDSMLDKIDFSYLARVSLSDCLFEFRKQVASRNKTIYEYVHLASKNVFNLSSYSVLNFLKPSKYIIASNMAIVSGVMTITEAIPVEFEDLEPNGFTIKDEVLLIDKYDPKTGQGRVKVNRNYKGYNTNTTLDTFTARFDNDEYAVHALANYLTFECKQSFIELNKNVLNRVKCYDSKLVGKDFLKDFYYARLLQDDITNLDMLKPIILDIKDVVDTPTLREIQKSCPTTIDGKEVRYVESKKGMISPVVELKYNELQDSKLINRIMIGVKYKVLTPYKQGSKIIYKPLKEASKDLITTQKKQLLRSALEVNDDELIGNITQLDTVPVLPEPIEYMVGEYIYPYFLIDFNNNLTVHWSEDKISSNQAIARINKAIGKKDSILQAIEYVDSEALDNKLLQLLINCGGNAQDKDYSDIKFLIDGIKSHKSDLNIDTRLRDIESRLDEELQYKYRSSYAEKIINDEFDAFKKKYDKKAYTTELVLKVDKVVIAKATKIHNFDKKKDYYVVEDIRSKVINTFKPLKFKVIEVNEAKK
jgi:HrpA-like RNA helicase